MSGIYGISAYQQINKNYEAGKTTPNRSGETASSKAGHAHSTAENSASKVETKGWSPIDAGSSLVPSKTEYGYTIGEVKLSDKAADYLNKLKSKFHNMEFITVSGAMKDQVKRNAASYGNANKTVVLIDEEKLERMATDENFRKKYEGIIAQSQSKMLQAKNSLASSGADIKNFGMSVDENGKESFFATVGKSQELQKERMEKKADEKKELKAREKKKAEKELREERIQKARDKKAEDSKKAEPDETEEAVIQDKEYITFEADSLDDLMSRVSSYSFDISAGKVMTDAERMVGTQIDFKG